MYGQYSRAVSNQEWVMMAHVRYIYKLENVVIWSFQFSNHIIVVLHDLNFLLIFQPINTQHKGKVWGQVVKRSQNLVNVVCEWPRVSVQGVKSLGGHFACLCRGFEFYEVKKLNFVIIFQKENGSTFIILIVKSLKKEQNSTNLLLCTPICRNKSAITPK